MQERPIRGRARRRVDRNALLMLCILAALLAFSALRIPIKFFKLATFKSIAFQIPEISLLSLGMLLCMIAGGIDLSTIGIANLSAVVCAKLLLQMPQESMGSMVAGIVASLLVGVLAGAFNGFLVGYIHIPAMLVTLSTLQVFTGLALAITKGPAITGIGEGFQQIANGTLLGVIPYSLIVLIACVILISFLLELTQYGTELYLMGTNDTASRYSGINNGWMSVRTYALSGLLSALAGVIICSHYGSAKSDYGSTYTLQTLLIVILGGANPNGGEGKPVDVVLAALILQVISAIFSILRVNSFVKNAVHGGVLIAMILLKLLLTRWINARAGRGVRKLGD